MRLILCAAALLSLCSVAHAERIEIVGLVADYATARDEVDVELWLTRPLDMDREWLAFTAGTTAALGGQGPLFGFANGPTNAPPLDYFDLSTWRRQSGNIVDRVVMPDLPVQFEERVRDGIVYHALTTTLSAHDIQLDRFPVDSKGNLIIYCVSYVRYIAESDGLPRIDRVEGYLTTDAPRLIHAPEPSSLVLAGVALHLLWLPRLRQRLRKRRAGVEPYRIGA